jgi:UDP-N-acetyl-2-amino-2-deoxyglucuronate dehydrogenase
MIGQGHAYAFRLLTEDGDVRPVAAADLSEASVRRAQRICPFERIGTDALAVINDSEVEAVAIATPTTTHLTFVRAALAAGKPLLCEKPLAADFRTVREMCELVASSGVTAQVGFHSRFHPVINELRTIVERGDLGRPMGYILRDDQYWPTGAVVPGHSSWRSVRADAGGGALLEHSIHSADILTWIFGSADRVYARTRRMFGYDVEDAAACTIEHSSGVLGTMLTIFNGVRGREERRLEVFFERGAVEITTDFVVGAPEDSFLVQRPDAGPVRLDMDQLREQFFAAAGIGRRDFMVYLYPAARAFVHAVRTKTPASPGFPDAWRAHALVEAAYRSAASGQPVELTGDLSSG